MKNAEQDVSDLILAAATASNAAAQALVEADKAIMKADVDQHRRCLAEAVSQQHVLAHRLRQLHAVYSKKDGPVIH